MISGCFRRHAESGQIELIEAFPIKLDYCLHKIATGETPPESERGSLIRVCEARTSAVGGEQASLLT
jgi:hypothetical protein